MKPIIIIILMSLFAGCSIFQTQEKENNSVESAEDTEEVYVFDDPSEDNETEESRSAEIKELEKEIDNTVKENDTVEVDVFDEPVTQQTGAGISKNVSYYLQLGAFSSLKRAEEFASKIETDVPFKLAIIYNTNTTYYNVRSTAYSTRSEVEKVRDALFAKNLFKDAFIVTE